MQLDVIEFALPPRHKHRGNTVAGNVGERANLAHELVDRKHYRHARHQSRINHGERRRERNEACAGDPAGALRRQHGDDHDGQLLAKCQVDAERLRDEQRRQRNRC